MTKRILIDCGASTGIAIPEVTKLFGPFDQIYAFEPNPENSRHINEKQPGATVVQAAVYIEAGKMKLYLGEKFDGSTLYADKLSGGIRADRFVEVDTIDFGSWLEKNVNKSDHVVCKMDIEGAEFDVLEHLIRTDKHQLLDVLLVEWHVSRFPDRWTKRWRRLMIKLRYFFAGIQMHVWH